MIPLSNEMRFSNLVINSFKEKGCIPRILELKFLGSNITKIPTLKMAVKLNPLIACVNRVNWDIKTSNPSPWVHFLQKSKHFSPSNYATGQSGMEFQIILFQCLSKQFLQLRYKPTTKHNWNKSRPRRKPSPFDKTFTIQMECYGPLNLQPDNMKIQTPSCLSLS